MNERIFGEREQGFEAKFAHDQEREFRIHARRDHLFGLWAAAQLGYRERAAEEYAASLVALDVHPAYPQAVVGRVAHDLAARMSEAAIRARFAECESEARREIFVTPAGTPA